MMVALDLTDNLSRFPLAYSWQPVRGWAVKHFDTTLGQGSQRTKQNALGEGPWDALEKLWADVLEISPADYAFHSGTAGDVPDANFPSDSPHPWTAYVSAKCPAGITEDQAEKLFGIYRTLKTPNFNGSGQQLNSAGTVVTPGDPRTEYFFKPNPANVSADQILRWGKRSNAIINYPAWVDWRDFNDELINYDDAAYTPRSLSLTPTSGGSLTPGATYYVRVSTIKSGDQSSASTKTIETKAHSITLLGGQTAFQVNWLIKGDEKSPAENPAGITGYRVFIGTVDGTWLGYFSVASPAARTLLITTTAGVTAGNPIDVGTSGLLIQIKRFECGLFFVPPYDLATALDRICQISCADWQWSGLGTGTYRNDKVRFMSPATRTPVFTLNLAETGIGSFKTYPVDRRSRPNQIVVNFRDRSDEFLSEGLPVILNREQLQEDEGQIKNFTIDGGTMYRSQAQRCASFYARVLCDMDQMAAMKASPKSYHILPGDTIKITNDTPDWTDIEFMLRRKGELVEGPLGDPCLLQLYPPGLYSDTDHSPLPRPLPNPKFDPFSPPPPAINVVLDEGHFTTANTTWISTILGEFDFQNYGGVQIARIYVKLEDEVDYRPVQIVRPDADNHGVFEILAPLTVGAGHLVKIVTENSFGNTEGLAAATAYPIFITGPPPIPAPTLFLGFFDLVDGDNLQEWEGEAASPTLQREFYQLQQLADDGVTVIRDQIIDPILNKNLSDSVIWKVVSDTSRQAEIAEVIGTITSTGTVAVTVTASGMPNSPKTVQVPVVNGDEDYEVAGKIQAFLKLDSDISTFLNFPTHESAFGDPSFLSGIFFEKKTPEANDPSFNMAIANGTCTGLTADPTSSTLGFTRLGHDPMWSLLLEGGIDFNWDAGITESGVTKFESVSVANIGDGLLFEFQIPPEGRWAPSSVTLFPTDEFYLGTPFPIHNPVYDFTWHCAINPGITHALPFYMWPEGISDDDLPWRRAVQEGDRIGIYLRPDGIGEYHINFLGDTSRPFRTSGKKVKVNSTYGVMLTFTQGGVSFNDTLFGIRKPCWVRVAPDFKYNAAAQRIDRGLAFDGTLPSVIKAGVRQKTPYTNGTDSPWTDGVFTRP